MKNITTHKKASLIALGLLTIWFILNLTGFKIGETVLVVSAFIDEPIDVLFFAIFCLFIFLYIRFEKVGKWLITIFLFGWALMQGSMYFRNENGIKSYNEFFLNENTHRIFPASENFLIKDTYHSILDVLILAALITTIIAVINPIIKTIIKKDKK